jgi:hypothetical protein
VQHDTYFARQTKSLKHEKHEGFGSRAATLSALKITQVRPRQNDSKVILCVRGKLPRLKQIPKCRKPFSCNCYYSEVVAGQ